MSLIIIQLFDIRNSLNDQSTPDGVNLSELRRVLSTPATLIKENAVYARARLVLNLADKLTAALNEPRTVEDVWAE